MQIAASSRRAESARPGPARGPAARSSSRTIGLARTSGGSVIAEATVAGSGLPIESTGTSGAHAETSPFVTQHPAPHWPNGRHASSDAGRSPAGPSWAAQHEPPHDGSPAASATASPASA